MIEIGNKFKDQRTNEWLRSNERVHSNGICKVMFKGTTNTGAKE